MRDAGPCPEPLFARLSINGVTEPAAPGEPFVHALLGDVIELSAAGSCTQQGTLSYAWQIAPVDGTRGTGYPDLASETITIYPTQAENYVITLTVSNGTDMRDLSVLGVTAHGWVSRDDLAGSQEIRDLAVGGDNLWIAQKEGAHGLPLGSEPGTAFAINEVADDLATVHYSTEARLVWFGQKSSGPGVWRVNTNETPAEVTQVAYDHDDALGENAEVLDIGAMAPGVALATKKGLTISADMLNFAGDFEPPDTQEVHAVTAGGGRRWAGGRRLYDLDNDGAPLDAFEDPGDNDHKIRALAVDEQSGVLWVGSDSRGIARTRYAGDFAVEATYSTAEETLVTDKIRGLAVEVTGPYAGDVWAATGSGVARYIRARDTWMHMNNNHGLDGRTDVRAVVVDEADGRRVIYAGTKNGLATLSVP